MRTLRFLLTALFKALVLFASVLPAQLCMILIEDGPAPLRQDFTETCLECYGDTVRFAWAPILGAGVLLQLLQQLLGPRRGWVTLPATIVVGALAGHATIALITHHWLELDSFGAHIGLLGALAGLIQGLLLVTRGYLARTLQQCA